jgi:hypothetical protein
LPAPKHLGKAAAELWRQIVASKPADWFDAGSGSLLEVYVSLVIQSRAVERRLVKLHEAECWNELPPVEKRAVALGKAITAMAARLRLTVQAVVERKSRQLEERGLPQSNGEDAQLLGLDGGTRPN